MAELLLWVALFVDRDGDPGALGVGVEGAESLVERLISIAGDDVDVLPLEEEEDLCFLASLSAFFSSFSSFFLAFFSSFSFFFKSFNMAFTSPLAAGELLSECGLEGRQSSGGRGGADGAKDEPVALLEEPKLEEGEEREDGEVVTVVAVVVEEEEEKLDGEPRGDDVDVTIDLCIGEGLAPEAGNLMATGGGMRGLLLGGVPGSVMESDGSRIASRCALGLS